MRIAYAAPDRSIQVCEPDLPGHNATTISVPGLRCTWPIWSPTGDLVAFSGQSGGSNGSGGLGLYAASVDELGPGLIYSNEPGSGGIAQGTPHYSCWSPDGARLAFIAQTAGGLTLFDWDRSMGSRARRLLDGGPMYFSWSPDSAELYVHSFTGHYLVDATGEEEPRQFPGISTQYMSPSWAGDSQRIGFFLDAGQNRQRLVAIDLEDQAVKVLTEIGGVAAVAWRPGSAQIGLVSAMIGSTGFYSGLTLIDHTTGDSLLVTDDRVLAFYWSPDGSRVAYVTSSEGAEGSLRLAVSPAEGGDVTYLPDFRPSQEQLVHFMFFDQYAQSIPIWSPDGTHLLVFGELGYHVERAPLSDDGSNRAIILDASGQQEPREVASAFIGCWEPQRF